MEFYFFYSLDKKLLPNKLFIRNLFLLITCVWYVIFHLSSVLFSEEYPCFLSLLSKNKQSRYSLSLSVVHFDLLDSALLNISFPLLYFTTSSQTSLAVNSCLTGCLPGTVKVGSIGIRIYSSLGFLQYLFFSLLFIQLLTRRLSLLSPLNELPFRIYLKSIWDDFVCLLYFV